MIIGESKRLILRTLEEQDTDSLMLFWGNPDVMKYCHGSICEREMIESAIRNYQALQKSRNHSVYAVVLKESGVVIGGCGFNTTDNPDEIELIYHFSKDYWGKGYATEAGKVCIGYIEKNPQFHAISASIDPENRNSESVLRKLGFQYIGMKWFENSKSEEPCYKMNMGGNGPDENGIT